jgi:F420-0:gamma-glutamyl ligase
MNDEERLAIIEKRLNELNKKPSWLLNRQELKDIDKELDILEKKKIVKLTSKALSEAEDRILDNRIRAKRQELYDLRNKQRKKERHVIKDSRGRILTKREKQILGLD